MSRLRDFRLIASCQMAGQTPPDTFLVWEPETEEFAELVGRIAQASEFEGVERKRGNWFCIFKCGLGRYRWQMPDEETARRVERYAESGGGLAYARRRAIRSYKFDDEAGKWRLLNIKNSKKWKTQQAERARVRRKKRAKQRAKTNAIERHKAWSTGFEEKLKSYQEE